MRILLIFWMLALAAAAEAHKPSDSYLTLRVNESAIEAQWDIALRDLDYALGLDADQDGAITWGELRARHADIASYVLARLQLAADGRPCTARMGEHLVDDHSDGAYAVLRFRFDCPYAPAELMAEYRLFFDLDPQHKGLLNLAYAGTTRVGIFSAEAPVQRFVIGSADPWRQFRDYVREGVWHIWIGFDHILFLLSLLLPAVLLRQAGRWRPAERFRSSFWEVAKVVTAFTLAHSITLSIAALGVVSLPSRWVESAIAASVVFAALNNIWPVVSERRWVMAFVFGLVHGFGFAGVLAETALPAGRTAQALLGFNLGVELGQIALVVALWPLYRWVLARVPTARPLVIQTGSAAVLAAGLYWFLTRALGAA